MQTNGSTDFGEEGAVMRRGPNVVDGWVGPCVDRREPTTRSGPGRFSWVECLLVLSIAIGAMIGSIDLAWFTATN